MSSLADLVSAYDRPVEIGKGALLQEMEALGGGAEARRLPPQRTPPSGAWPPG
jgi:hypothetical protein